MTSAEQTAERVHAALANLAAGDGPAPRDGTLTLEVSRGSLHAVLERLKEQAGFETITMVTCVDHLGGRRSEPRFEVVHQLLSIEHRDRVRVKTRVASDDASVPTCTDLWPGASFMEREAYDMFGVTFEGHPNLARLLMPEEYGHHPLRKDFPHQGIEPDRLYKEWDRERRARAAREQAGGSVR